MNIYWPTDKKLCDSFQLRAHRYVYDMFFDTTVPDCPRPTSFENFPETRFWNFYTFLSNKRILKLGSWNSGVEFQKDLWCKVRFWHMFVFMSTYSLQDFKEWCKVWFKAQNIEISKWGMCEGVRQGYNIGWGRYDSRGGYYSLPFVHKEFFCIGLKYSYWDAVHVLDN